MQTFTEPPFPEAAGINVSYAVQDTFQPQANLATLVNINYFFSPQKRCYQPSPLPRTTGPPAA